MTMNTEQMRAHAKATHRLVGEWDRRAAAALREAADRIDADDEHIESQNIVLDGLHDRIDALEGALREMAEQTARVLAARALLASESLNTGEPT